LPPQEVWALVGDPHHLPRWWPRVSRVEGVEEAAFTTVLSGRAGRSVRADFRIETAEESEGVLRWAQQIDGTPFARLLAAAQTEIKVKPNGAATDVTIELRQSLRGVFPRVGGRRIRRAAALTIEEALNGLDRIAGPGAGQGRQA
jgi:uncharacterized protein YndB with AHSA1/START domain